MPDTTNIAKKKYTRSLKAALQVKLPETLLIHTIQEIPCHARAENSDDVPVDDAQEILDQQLKNQRSRETTNKNIEQKRKEGESSEPEQGEPSETEQGEGNDDGLGNLLGDLENNMRFRSIRF